MTAAKDRATLGGAFAAAPADAPAGSPVTLFSGASRLRTALALARVEARLLARSPLVLAGLLAGGLVIWILLRSVQPLWWNVAWQIGYGQAFLAVAVLIAAQVAAGRARRDAMADLYASFPATAGTRTLGQLAGLAGAAPASLLLIGATAAVVTMRGPVGAPGIAPLAAGVLLVIAAGAAGIATGTWFPHPLAGLLAGLAALVPVVETNNISGPGSWLLPWQNPDQLGHLPGPLAGYPPAAAHAIELAAIAVLAGVVALAVNVRGGRGRGLLAITAVLAVAATCLAGAVQLRPIPTADLNYLVRETAAPASVQVCTTAGPVRYCMYPSFGRDLTSLEAPVSGVLAHLPARPVRRLTVMQVSLLNFPDPTLTHGHPWRQVSRWDAQVQRAPGTAATTSSIYLPVGSWPAAGRQLADARFDLALSAAEWAVGLAPTASSASLDSGAFQPCVPLGQAREAIAIWLAILATRPPAGELQSGLANQGVYAKVGNSYVALWTYPGSNAGGYLAPQGASPQTTVAGYLLARAMTGLSEQKVTRILAGGWPRWLNRHASDAQLAAALGIPMPNAPAVPAATIAAGLPQNPLCGG